MIQYLESPLQRAGAALLFVLCVVATSYASMPHGAQISAIRGNKIAFKYTPTISSWDTVLVDGQQQLRPHIDGARIRQSANGSTIQWVVCIDVIVPGVVKPSLQSVQSNQQILSLPLQRELLPNGSTIQTVVPNPKTVSVSYTGQARETHYVTIECVVAESNNGQTIVHPQFAGELTLDFINTPVTSVVKKGESIQVAESLTDVFLISLQDEGVYRLSGQQLRDAGVRTDAEAALNLKVYGRGGMELNETVEPPQKSDLIEQPIIVKTNSDGSISEIVFYASGPNGFAFGRTEPNHYIHHFSTTSGYLLSIGPTEGLRSTVRAASSENAVNKPLMVKGYVFNEEELYSPYNSGSGRKWLGRIVENGGSMLVTTSLPGLVRNGNVDYRFMLAHKGTKNGTYTVFENGTALCQRVLPPLPMYMDAYAAGVNGSISASTIGSDGQSVLKFQYTCSDVVSTGLIDWFEIHYPRGMVADNNEFSFFTDPIMSGVSEYSVNGFSGNEMYAFDVTDRAHPIRVENVAPSGGSYAIREELDSGVARRYFISSNIRGTSIRKITYSNLRTTPRNADLIVITNPATQASAQRFADYRSAASGINVAVVTTEEIFNEFSYGVQDPTAFRDFLQYTYHHWIPAPKNVLLFGDCHFDYKGISTTTKNLVIPYESLDPDDTAWGINTYTSDDYFVRIAGEDARIEMAVGRLPISSDADGDKFIEKIRLYETQSAEDDWRTRVGLIADDGATSNGESDKNTHLVQSEVLSKEYIPESVQPKKVYLVEYPTENIARGRRKPSVTAEYVSAINTSGLLLLNWIGHGNPRVWAHESIFERETTPPTMTNSHKYFFLTAATCDFARFDMTETQSGAEELVMREGGGAIGSFSAARVVYSTDNALINQEFYKQLFTLDENGNVRTLGDVMYDVKQSFSGPNDEKFLLMADPSMKLLIPNHSVVFESVNGQEISDSARITIKALSTITVTGRISRPLQTTADETFNGIATISLMDAIRNVSIVDNDKYSTVNNFTMPGAALSRGSYKVENGKFVATFVVPKDIAFSSSNARLYGYAISTDKRTAKGTTDDLVVDSVATTSYDDDHGPDIKIYMDSRFFRGGDVVRSTPILIVDLEDKTGINTTGIGVGHDIEAVFDNGEMVEILTSDFSTSLENPRAGSATKQIFGLPAGEHTLRVRAWDVLNNMMEANTTFRIATSQDGVVTSWLMNYPNPFTESTTIRFQHNVSQPFDALIRIFDTQGRLIQERPMTITDMQTAEFVWDGRDDEGNRMGTGIYQCVVRINNGTGETADVAGKLALIR